MRYVTGLAMLLAATVTSTATAVRAEVRPATFDLNAIRDAATLETKVVQDWRPAPKLEGVKQKCVEITVCEWWPGQKVRLPVTLCVSESATPCENVIVMNQGLALKASLPSRAELELLTKHGVGVVMVGMGTIDAMEPVGQLHVGMKQQLLATKDARFTPAWIWGMSDMRALTAAIAEPDVFRPKKVLATGGSKRGVGAAICGIHDDRFTAILPVVAPIMASPGGAYVRGSALVEEEAMNQAFLEDLPKLLPDTTRHALEDRDERRLDQSITREEATAAGWSEAEMLQMNDEAWTACLIAKHLDAVRGRGLEFFYHEGTNDNVSPELRELGEKLPEFPLYILPGGQHGGPKGAGFTLQTPTQPEAYENLFVFARHHFFGDRSIPKPPTIAVRPVGGKLRATVTFASGVVPHSNTLSWCVDRHRPYTFAAEYDRWQSLPLSISESTDGDYVFTAEVEVPAAAKTVDFISTHTHDENAMPFHFSSPYVRYQR